MFENIIKFFKNLGKKQENKQLQENSKQAAKERLHLVLMQDRANVSADFLELMKQEIIEVIKKYIEIDEKEIDVRLTNKENEDGTNGAPALYANIPILNIKNEARKINKVEKEDANQTKTEEKDKKSETENKDEKVIKKVKKIEKVDKVQDEEKTENDKETEDKINTRKEKDQNENKEEKIKSDKKKIEEEMI